MHTDISEYSTEDLLRLSRSEADQDLAYQALWTVFKRWDSGIDTSLLIDFIDTEVIGEKLRGTYFLFEVSPRVDAVKDAVLELADDTLAECRRAFVGYLINSGWYDDAAAKGLVNCIQDFDIRVRQETIDWAILTTDERFEDFSRRVISGASEGVKLPSGRANPWTERIMKRGIRALTISRRLRDGESVAQIRKTTPDEDGFTFDHLDVFESHYERQRKRRQNAQEMN